MIYCLKTRSWISCRLFMVQRKTRRNVSSRHLLGSFILCTNIKNDKSYGTVGRNKKINGPIKTLKASSHCSLYCMSSSCGVRGQWLLQWTLRPPRPLLEFVLPLWLHTFLAALQWTSFFLFVPCRWFTVVRGEVCVFSQACVKVAAQGGKQCVCVGGVQVGLIMHRQQWLQWRRPASDCAMWVLEVLEIERNRHTLKQFASCRFCDSHFPKMWLFSRQDRWTVSLAKHFLDTWRQYFPCYLTVSSNYFFCDHCFDP